MCIKRYKRFLAIGLSVCLTCGGVSAVQAFDGTAAQSFPLICGELDADGNTVREYAIDRYGRETALPEAQVRASADDSSASYGVQANAQSLPSSYDMRKENCVTDVRNQGGAECCWAFSSTGAMEISYVRQGFGSVSNTDFSEAHLTWFGQRQRTTDRTDPTYGDGLYRYDPFSNGGNWQIMSSTLLRGSGMQYEHNAPWYTAYGGDDAAKAERIRRMQQPESARYVSHCRLWSAEGIMDLSRERAKQLIMENGSFIMSYHHENPGNDPYFNSSRNAYYRGIDAGSNHSVTVIGWNDNFSRTYFNSSARPSSNGAWLVKGSWGTSYGDNGFYWISYEEPSIKSMSSFRAAPEDIYDTIYQYDGSYPSTYFKNNADGSGMANLFTSKQEEMLTHVTFFNINSTPVNATVTVYLDGGDTHSASAVDPTNGMHIVQEATTTMQDVHYGYFTVQLRQQVPLHEGDRFLVMVSFDSSDDTLLWIPVEGFTVDLPAEGVPTYSGNVGESFLYLNETWFDSNNLLRKDYNSVPVKAMTKRMRVEESLEVRSLPEQTSYAVGTSFDPTGLELLYTADTGKQTVVTSGYTVSAPAFSAPGDYIVKITYKNLVCSLTVNAHRTPGDASGDGVVDLRDVVLMRRILVGWKDLVYYDVNLDVNGDGKLTLVDVAIVTRYVTGGYDVELI